MDTNRSPKPTSEKSQPGRQKNRSRQQFRTMVPGGPTRLARQRRWRGVRSWALRIGSVLAFLSAWWLLTNTGLVDPLFFPSPQNVLEASRQSLGNGELLTDAVVSFRRVFVGFIAATLIGVPAGVVLGVSRTAKSLSDPVISLLRPLPSLTWIPLTMLWFGIGETQKYSIVFLGSVLYIVLYTMETTKRTDPILIRAAENLGASQTQMMRSIILPASLPGIYSGLKVTLAISWSCVLSAELVAATSGLGALIWRAKDAGNLPLILVGMGAISMTVLVIDLAMRGVESKLFPWERSRAR